MQILGAHLDDLDRLAAQLRRTAGEIADVHARANSATSAVATEIRSAVSAGTVDIGDAMATLRASVAASTSTADGVSWSGLNRDRFLDAHREFDAAMSRAESTTSAAFTDFGSSVEQLTGAIEHYISTLGGSLANAADAADSMAVAVEQQRTNLDQVMNQGLGIQ